MRVAYRPELIRRISCAILALGTAFGVAGCSDDSTRFNYPALGMADTDTGAGAADYSTTSSLPPQGGYNRTAPKRSANYKSSQTRDYGSQAATPPVAPIKSYAAGPRVTVQQG